MTFSFTRRRLLGSTLAATGAILTGLGFAHGQTLTSKGQIMLDSYRDQPLRRQRRPGCSGTGLPVPDAGGQPSALHHRSAGVFEAHVPPHHADMRAAVKAVVARKFGKGGPFDPGQGGQYRENAAVRGSGAQIDDEAVEIATIMADYVFSTFRRFPATAPAVFINTYLQAHRLDTGFYDMHFQPGAYLRTHANHDQNWG